MHLISTPNVLIRLLLVVRFSRLLCHAWLLLLLFVLLLLLFAVWCKEFWFWLLLSEAFVFTWEWLAFAEGWLWLWLVLRLELDGALWLRCELFVNAFEFRAKVTKPSNCKYKTSWMTTCVCAHLAVVVFWLAHKTGYQLEVRIDKWDMNCAV